MDQMEESSMSSRESLDLIESMINKAKNNFQENGHLYLVWGWVVLFCSLFQYIASFQLGYQHGWRIWMLTWLVIPYMIYYLRKQKKREKVKTYTDEILGSIWMVFGISMFLLAIVIGGQTGKNVHFILTPVFVTVYGIPTVLSGIILRFRPLLYGGVACWLLAIASVFIAPKEHLLLVAAAMIFAWIIPGYLLKNRYKKELLHV